MRLVDASVSADCLPTFLCVGAEKSGTTSLYDELRNHPQIGMSPIKETNYFSTDVRVENFREDYRQHEKNKKLDLDAYFSEPELADTWGAYIEKESQYLRLFENSRDCMARGEISNSYLYSQEAAQNIADTLPDARVLVLLRNPVYRTFSHYRAMVRDGRTAKSSLIEEIEYDLSFKDRRWGGCHGYIDHSIYSQQLPRLLSCIDPCNIKVLLSEELFASRESVLAEVFSFLQVEPGLRRNAVSNRNLSVSPRNEALIRWLTNSKIKAAATHLFPGSVRNGLKALLFSSKGQSMTKGEEEYLKQFFKDEKQRVESILDRELTPWEI